MSYKITTIHKPTYTHFIVEGKNTAENTMKYLSDIYGECTANNYKCILIEERLEGKLLGTMDVYDIVSNASQKALGFFKAIAYVDTNPDNISMNFVETLAVNRALPVNTFQTVDKAEKWLTSRR